MMNSPLLLPKVLQLLPESWSVGLLAQFLTRAVRTSMHNSRMTRIERMMARGENLHVKQTFIEMQRDGIVMSEDRYTLDGFIFWCLCYSLRTMPTELILTNMH